jgi:DNA gyrase subunit B
VIQQEVHAKQARNRKTQAILPLERKILNSERSQDYKILSSTEVGSLISALGCGFNHESDDFDLEKLRYGKIIIMTDADVDGAHIRTLLLTLLARKLKPLFDDGRVYIAQPPLYKIKKGKTEKYIQNDDELNRFLASSFFDSKSIDFDGMKMSSKECSEVLISYSKIPSVIRHVNRSKDKTILKCMSLIPPLSDKIGNTEKDLKDYLNLLLKMLKTIAPINISYTLSYEKLEHQSFQINVVKKVNGVVDPSIVPINKKFFSSQTYKNLISLNLHKFYNGEIILQQESGCVKYEHIYGLCDEAFSAARKSISLQRYKGLGEMNPSQLAETTMNPETRSLLKVSQISDDDYSIFDTLMGEDVEKRRDFIVSSANTIDHVDI